MKYTIEDLCREVREAYRVAHSNMSDFAVKSDDGAIQVTYESVDWLSMDLESDVIAEPQIMIYSYLFGDGRRHYFDTLSDARDEVRKWRTEAESYTNEEW